MCTPGEALCPRGCIGPRYGDLPDCTDNMATRRRINAAREVVPTRRLSPPVPVGFGEVPMVLTPPEQKGVPGSPVARSFGSQNAFRDARRAWLGPVAGWMGTSLSMQAPGNIAIKRQRRLRRTRLLDAGKSSQWRNARRLAAAPVVASASSGGSNADFTSNDQHFAVRRANCSRNLLPLTFHRWSNSTPTISGAVCRATT